METSRDINRLKVVLAEQKKTNKWLSEQLQKDQATISKWCNNKAQPGLETLVRIAECLDVDVRTLIVQTKKSQLEMAVEIHKESLGVL